MLEPDFTFAIIGSLVVVILVLIGYISYKFREAKAPMVHIDINELLNRFKEAEQVFQAVRDSRCWNCGSTEKEVIGNLYQDDEIRTRCKVCNTETIWRRGKKEWKMTTGTKSFIQLLEERVSMEKAKTGGR
ncbi:MAG: hypothetical protein QXH20_01525 [Candidatus Bathyarchaeia archaeon]